MTDESDKADDLPVFLKGRKPITLPLQAVVNIVKLLEDNGQLDALLKVAEQADAHVTVHPGTVNLVKKFVASDPIMRDSTIGLLVMRPTRNADKFKCDFS